MPWYVINTICFEFTGKVHIQNVQFTKDLLNTSQTFLPLSHLDPWKEWKTSHNIISTLPRDLSQVPTDSHSHRAGA